VNFGPDSLPAEAAPVDAATCALLARASVSTVATALFRRGLRAMFLPGLVPLAPGTKFAGPAFTLRAIPMRPDLGTPDYMTRFPENLQRAALDRCPQGAVLVADCFGETRAGLFGGILATHLANRRIAGAVIDGCVRDAHEVAASGLAVLCRGSAAAGSQAMLHVVGLDQPIGVAGVSVFPGDAILADPAGAIVVPAALAPAIAQEAAETEAFELWAKARIAAGAPLAGTYPPDAATRALYEAEQRQA
jgi:regulator of RNase E activity RraA